MEWVGTRLLNHEKRYFMPIKRWVFFLFPFFSVQATTTTIEGGDGDEKIGFWIFKRHLGWYISTKAAFFGYFIRFFHLGYFHFPLTMNRHILWERIIDTRHMARGVRRENVKQEVKLKHGWWMWRLWSTMWSYMSQTHNSHYWIALYSFIELFIILLLKISCVNTKFKS